MALKHEAQSGESAVESANPRASEVHSRAPLRAAPAGENVAPGESRWDAREACNGPNVEPGREGEPPAIEPPAIEPPIRTHQSPLSELPRCIVCREFVGPVFRVVDFHVGIVNPDGVRHVAGLAMAHRLPLGLAEIFATEPPPINISDDPRVDDRAIYCQECFAYSDMPQVMELIRKRKAEAKKAERS
jgi:hypothetical protein